MPTSTDARPLLVCAGASVKLFITDPLALLLAGGYGCFRAANSLLFSTVLGENLASSLLMPELSLAVSIQLLFVVFGLAVAFVAYRGWLGAFRIPVMVPALVLVAAVYLFSGGFFGGAPPWVSDVAVSVTYALAVLCLNLAWTERLVSLGLVKCLGGFALGMLLRAIIESVAVWADASWMLAVVVALLLVSVFILKLTRGWVRPVDSDASKMTWSDYGGVFSRMKNAVLVMIFLDAAVSFLDGFFSGSSLFAESNVVRVVGTLGAALCFFVVAFALPVWRDSKRAFRLLYPVLAASIALLPFVGNGQSGALGAVVLFSYHMLTSCTLYFVLVEVITSRAQVYVVMGLLTALARAVQAAFVLIGNGLANMASREQIELYALVALAVVYGLGLLLVVFSRKRKSGESQDRAPEAASVLPGWQGGNDEEVPQALRALSDIQQEYFLLRAEELACAHHLTKREREVLVQLAQGRSNTFISERFVCAPGTIKTHVKSIYVKLDVHSRQEIINLFVRE